MAEQSPDILLVEDDAEIAYLIRFMLEREKISVEHTLDGRLASEWIQSHPSPKLVLLDLMLPYRDGFQLLEEMRQKSGWEKTPVFVLSAKNQESDIVRALDLGANDYVTKPFQPLELLTRVKKALR